MAKGERTVNPATAHLKSQKNRAIKKNKAAVQEQRTQRLASRNPDRLQRQIDELKAVETAQSGQLRPRDKQQLEQLEREVKAIRQARETTGAGDSNTLGKRRREDSDGAPHRGGRGGQRGGRGRPREDTQVEDGEEDTDPEVRSIPMPRDTPPPIPPRRLRNTRSSGTANASGFTAETNRSLPTKPPAVAQTTFSAAPEVRDLKKESTAAFMPSAVASRMKQVKGQGGRYLEPEEVDKLERAGYLAAKKAADEAGKEEAFEQLADEANASAGNDEAATLDEQEAALERELMEAERDAAMEDVEKIASEAEKEAQFEMMAEEGEGKRAAAQQERVAERKLNTVEVEEVEDAGD